MQINISYLYCQTAKVLNGEIIFVKETIDTKNNDFLLDNFTLRFKNLFQCGSDSWYLYDMIRFAPMDEQEKDSRIFIITIGNKRTGCTYGVWAATKKYAKEYNCNYQKELIPYMHKISAVLQAE